MSKPPLVSVFMMTYNHEKFIAQALDMVLMQKVNFSYEIVLGDDCSTDNTRNIVIRYNELYPDKFKLLLHKENKGAINNQTEVFRNCTGKYIAMCEGDDYWTDPLKLQKQVDFLEANPGYSLCFHNAITKNTNRQIKDTQYCNFSKDLTFTIDDLFKGNFIPTASVIFRNNINELILSKLSNVNAGDWFLHIYNAQFGKIYYLNENMAVYNVHENGAWAGLNKDDAIRFKIDAIFSINRAFDYKYNKEFKELIFNWYKEKPVGIKDIYRYYKKKYYKKNNENSVLNSSS